MTRGRPPKEPDDLLKARINFALMPEEKAAYEDAAAQAGLKLSAWIRDRLEKAAKKERALERKGKAS